MILEVQIWMDHSSCMFETVLGPVFSELLMMHNSLFYLKQFAEELWRAREPKFQVL